MIRKCPFTQREMIVVDFEFYYDQDYTLSKLPIAQFMLDPRFELMITSIEYEVGKPEYFIGGVKEAREWIKQFDIDNKIVIAHYAFIEGAVLEWKLGVKPQAYFCTLAGSRPFFVPWTGSAALDSLGPFVGAGEKGDYSKRMKGKHLADTPADEMFEYAVYGMNDVKLTGLLADAALAKFVEWNPTGDELVLIDLTIKKFTRPKLKLDPAEIAAAYAEVVEKKRLALEACGVPRGTLMSDQKLANHIEALGHDVPMTHSKAYNSLRPSFAKTNAEFLAMRRFGPEMAALVDARLTVKSTIEETRLKRFSDIAQATRGVLPVPLMYYGAHTGRLSGVDKLNLQNLGRKSRLRAALVAPRGYRIVTGDLSQIEARITAVLAGQHDLVEDFRNGVDVYSKFATRLYGYTVTREQHEAKERFVGKTSILSLGFMAGAPKLHATMNDVHHFPMTMDEANRIVKLYRSTYWRIPQLWTTLDLLLSQMMHLGTRQELGPLQFCYQHIVLPNGMPIFYRDLTRTSGGLAYIYGFKPEMVFSGKALENVVSAMARIIMTNAELRLAKLGLRAALSVHDELVFVVKESEVDVVKALVTQHLSKLVSWMPKLPVACSVKDGANYLEAK